MTLALVAQLSRYHGCIRQGNPTVIHKFDTIWLLVAENMSKIAFMIDSHSHTHSRIGDIPLLGQLGGVNLSQLQKNYFKKQASAAVTPHKHGTESQVGQATHRPVTVSWGNPSLLSWRQSLAGLHVRYSQKRWFLDDMLVTAILEPDASLRGVFNSLVGYFSAFVTLHHVHKGNNESRFPPFSLSLQHLLST